MLLRRLPCAGGTGAKAASKAVCAAAAGARRVGGRGLPRLRPVPRGHGTNTRCADAVSCDSECLFQSEVGGDRGKICYLTGPADQVVCGPLRRWRTSWRPARRAGPLWPVPFCGLSWSCVSRPRIGEIFRPEDPKEV